MGNFMKMIVSVVGSIGIVLFLISPMLEKLPETLLSVDADSDCQEVYKENLFQEPSIRIGLFKSMKASPNLDHAEVYNCAAEDIDKLFTGI